MPVLVEVVVDVTVVLDVTVLPVPVLVEVEVEVLVVLDVIVLPVVVVDVVLDEQPANKTSTIITVNSPGTILTIGCLIYLPSFQPSSGMIELP